MDVSEWPDSEIKTIALEIERLDLAANVHELELFGLTVVDASITGAAELTDRALTRALDLIEERSGTRPDVSGGATHVDVFLPSLFRFLHEDPVFQQLMLQPKLIGLVTYLVGQ